MILSYDDFCAMGFRASTEDAAMIERAIADTELFFVKNVVGADSYADMLTAEQGTDYWYAVNGTSTMAGVKVAIGHFAFATMLLDNLNWTRTGSVKKRDDYSTPADEDNIYKLQRYHYTIGKRYMDEVCDFLGIKPNYNINYLNEYEQWTGKMSL